MTHRAILDPQLPNPPRYPLLRRRTRLVLLVCQFCYRIRDQRALVFERSEYDVVPWSGEEAYRVSG